MLGVGGKLQQSLVARYGAATEAQLRADPYAALFPIASMSFRCRPACKQSCCDTRAQCAAGRPSGGYVSVRRSPATRNPGNLAPHLGAGRQGVVLARGSAERLCRHYSRPQGSRVPHDKQRAPCEAVTPDRGSHNRGAKRVSVPGGLDRVAEDLARAVGARGDLPSRGGMALLHTLQLAADKAGHTHLPWHLLRSQTARLLASAGARAATRGGLLACSLH